MKIDKIQPFISLLSAVSIVLCQKKQRKILSSPKKIMPQFNALFGRTAE